MAEPKSTQMSHMSQVLVDLLQDLTQQAETEQEDRRQSKQCQWQMPPKKDWSGNLFK